MIPSAQISIQKLWGSPLSWETRQLAACLDHFHAAASTSARVESWITLVRWTRRHGGRLSTIPSPGIPAPWQRLDALLRVLESDSTLLQHHSRTLHLILQQAEFADFFADCGIPSDRSTLAVVADEIMRRLLPPPRDDRYFATLLCRLFPTIQSARRLQHLPESFLARLAHVLSASPLPGKQPRLLTSLADSFVILSVRVQAQLLSEQIRSRLPEIPFSRHPARLLAEVTESLRNDWEARNTSDAALARWQKALDLVHDYLAQVAATQENAGVRVDLIHTLETTRQCLRRMETIVGVLSARDNATSLRRLHSLVGELAVANLRGRDPLRILSSRTALLHRKIVERAGQTGSHYISRNLKEYAWIWKAAAGGGLLTVGTAAIKLGLHELHGLPLFITGLAAGLNYAVSFMLLHHAHLILATKQPAMTAAHLARIIRETSGPDREAQISSYTARICHSQLAAATANVVAVALGSVLLVIIWRALTGHSLIPAESAHYTLRTLSPLDSATFFFAAWTGVLLWAASLIGGWLDNWAACHRLADGVAALPALPGFSRRCWAKTARAIRKHFAAWGTNISLGFLLGLSPAFGAFVGIPLEVRHVTLSTGQLALASASLGPHWLAEGFFLRAAAGIAVMFVLNLSVSFLCSLLTAARAYQMTPREVMGVLLGIARTALIRPRDFILPPPRDFPASRSE